MVNRGISTSENVSLEQNMPTVLGNLPDLKNERSVLQHTVESREYVLLLSPKFRTEIAGVGIEYSSGMSNSSFVGR